MRALLICGLVLSALSSVMCARILAVLPMPGKSHFIFCNAILTGLAARGHQITVIAPFTPSKPVPNIKYIEIHTQFEEVMKKSWTFDTFKAFVNKPFFANGGPIIWQLSYTICEETLQHEKVKELIASKEKFDIVIAEAFFGEESLFVFGHLFNAPVVNVNGFGTWSVMNKVHGNALQIASIPDCVSFDFTNHMTFIERFRNLVSIATTLVMYYYDHLPKHQSIINKVFNDPKIPPLEDMVSNVSLTLANFHPTVGYPLSVPSNIVPVGGVHIAKDLAPLPKDVKAFMDSGKNAVIYFSLGTVVPVHLMPPEYLKIFTNVFRKLPYKIIWKIEADSVPDLPSNVMIAKWLPQQSVLAHPNCVLFITHGGLLSQHEVLHAGVPVVGIPFFGDQPFNVRLYEQLGVGVKLDFATLSEESMLKAINSVVGKPEFIKKAKEVSEMFQHRPMSAVDTAVFWTEYVIRHRDTRHLRPAAALMPWYQLALLDIVGFVLAVLFVALIIVKKTLSLLFGLCCGKKSKQETVSTKKKKN